MIEFFSFQSPIGFISIVAMKEGVLTISFENKSRESIDKWCLKHLGIGIIPGNKYTKNAQNQITRYLCGKRKTLNFPVIHLNSTFYKKVLDAERKIPYGETRSYQDMAMILENPKALRAVGGANANNPLPLYYPCHRIICTDGSLGGFGGGLHIKQFLLEVESQNSLG